MNDDFKPFGFRKKLFHNFTGFAIIYPNGFPAIEIQYSSLKTNPMVRKVLLIVSFVFLFSFKSFAQKIVKTKFVGIVDGDTVTVLDKQYRQFTVRLAGTDTPEKAQDFGATAKEFLHLEVIVDDRLDLLAKLPNKKRCKGIKLRRK